MFQTSIGTKCLKRRHHERDFCQKTRHTLFTFFVSGLCVAGVGCVFHKVHLGVR